MISKIVIPDLGATGGDVILEEWLVEPGQEVKARQPLYVVATDKATVEVEAYRDGVIHSILISQGETVSLGTVIGLLADSIDEEIEIAEDESVGKTATPESEILHLPINQSGDRILASPLARRIAAEEDISLELLNGSGSRGQILKRDVIAMVNAQKIVDSPTRILREPLSPMRKVIAERTSLSKSQIPHFYTNFSICSIMIDYLKNHYCSDPLQD